MADPWMKFFTSDWRADPRLKMCSAGARGVWIEMICLMHEAKPYGHLLIHGQPPNEAQLASLTGILFAEIGDYLAELERMGVFSRTKEGVIYSRKLVRMEAKSAKARKSGKMGGNPRLSKERENTKSLNLEHNPDVKTQKPEAIYQTVEVDKSTSCPFSDFWAVWPNRVSKAAAEKAWAKLSQPDRSEAVRETRSWFERWRAANPQASPIHPASYLNQKRWRDEFSPQILGGNHVENGNPDTWRGNPTNNPSHGDAASNSALRAIARAAGSF